METAARVVDERRLAGDRDLGRRGLSVQQVVRLATTLKVSPDEILGQGREEGGSFRDRRFVKRLQKIEKLSKRQKQALLVTLDHFLKGAGVS